MAAAERAEMNSQGDEVESPLRPEQQHKNHPFSSLGRESSIYSLTLGEFQHTLCESGKNFGSMNMEEFLSSIWNAEENQAINSNQPSNDNSNLPLSEAGSTENGIRTQPSLPRQGSLTIPAPLCRKTVEEVWSEIHKGQQGQQKSSNGANDNVQNTESAPRQPTFGEMTLEDFLIKAGVVREPCPMPAPVSHQRQYGLYAINNSTMGTSIAGGPAIGIAGGAGNVVASYQAVGQGGGAIGDPSRYAGNGKSDSGYPSAGVCCGGRAVNGGGGYGATLTIGMRAAVSPVSPDGLATSENSATQFGLDMDVLRGRKRMSDGPAEKVEERRQRRMIKNRESAARSRDRKQAYTVELETELNQLREVNANLKQSLAELERRRERQLRLEELNWRAILTSTKAQKATEKLRGLRRNQSCHL